LNAVRNFDKNWYSSKTIKEIESFSLNELWDRKFVNLSGSNFILRGIQDDVAAAIETTRQNVQKYYSKSVAYERMYASEILLLLGDIQK